MSQHTPGPWMLYEMYLGDTSIYLIRGGERLPNPEKPDGLNELPPAILRIHSTDHGDFMANARVATAAAELLAAAKSLVQLEHIGRIGVRETDVTRAYGALEAAIAKAEGGVK